MGTEIRPYIEADSDTLKEFIAALQDYEAALCPDLKPGMEISEAYAASILQDAALKNGLLLMALHDSVPAGFICGWADESDDSLVADSGRAHAYISDIYVREDLRGRDVAAMLFETFEREMRRRGARRFRVNSKAANLAAVKFYLKRDYSPYEIIFEKVLPPG